MLIPERFLRPDYKTYKPKFKKYCTPQPYAVLKINITNNLEVKK